MTRAGFAIRFDFPDGGGPVYAGRINGAYSWASSIETAELYDDAAEAGRVLEDAYGVSARDFGRVVRVSDELAAP